MSFEPRHETNVGRRTIHVGLRVSDRDRSLNFYRSLGYDVVGEVPDTPIGHLTMLKLPGDEFVSIELVSGPPAAGSPGLSHLVVTVNSLGDAVQSLHTDGIIDRADAGTSTDPTSPRTLIIADPDGNKVELVQWPDGHPDGFTPADWPDS
jgi:lactoylglutathione lyase